MHEKEKELLATFEVRMRDLIVLCNEQKRRTEELEASLREKDEAILQARQLISALQTKYTNLLTARQLAEDATEFQQARKRVNKLVREVDLCIALLNE
jgi:DNA repair exonuclease SbcCD ATPase subunit